MSFRAILITKTETGQKAELTTLEESDLMEGDVTVDVSHSSVNFKDGLAVTGKAPIARRFPLIPGIDFAGVVRSSTNPRWKAGDQVVLNGYGVGEGHHGGFSEVARVNGDWLVPVPQGWTAADCMAVGVAGYTAMLCVMALEEQGVKPSDGDILVTGAAGGVGTTAIAILSHLGYRVIAATGRVAEEAFLRDLGAAGVVDRSEFNGPVKPLAKPRWAGCVDSVGSVTLANVLSQMNPDATVAACGLAQGMDLPASVAPFILRGVKLVGINSVSTPMPRRLKVWERLAKDLELAKLKALTTHVKLDDVPRIANDIVAGKVRGRVVVDIR
jgi:acrylyl-CoA reductase (NADPH)